MLAKAPLESKAEECLFTTFSSSILDHYKYPTRPIFVKNYVLDHISQIALRAIVFLPWR